MPFYWIAPQLAFCRSVKVDLTLVFPGHLVNGKVAEWLYTANGALHRHATLLVADVTDD